MELVLYISEAIIISYVVVGLGLSSPFWIRRPYRLVRCR